MCCLFIKTFFLLQDIFKLMFLLNDYLCIQNHVNLIFKTIWGNYILEQKLFDVFNIKNLDSTLSLG